VVTSTNGHFIRDPEAAEKIVESGLDEIIISLDGVDQSTYTRYRKGGNIEKVFDGIRLLAEAKLKLRKSQPSIHLQFILMKQNLEQRESMIQIGRNIGADKLSFKTLQLTDWDSGKEFLPDSPELTRYDSILPGKTFITRKRHFFPNECLRLWYSLVVNCDGTISPCCFDKDGKFVLGNLLNESFETIWKGEKYQEFRQSLLKQRYNFEMCKDCTEGLKNLFISTINYHEKKDKS
jgi:radical SAM protein with 4Fe4S-binding SPASM domain